MRVFWGTGLITLGAACGSFRAGSGETTSSSAASTSTPHACSSTVSEVVDGAGPRITPDGALCCDSGGGRLRRLHGRELLRHRTVSGLPKVGLTGDARNRDSIEPRVTSPPLRAPTSSTRSRRGRPSRRRSHWGSRSRAQGRRPTGRRVTARTRLDAGSLRGAHRTSGEQSSANRTRHAEPHGA
jgi:hypothetical protein